MLSDDLVRWDNGVRGRSKGKEIYIMYIELIHSVVEQKLTQHCNVIILQLKKKNGADYRSMTGASTVCR